MLLKFHLLVKLRRSLLPQNGQFYRRKKSLGSWKKREMAPEKKTFEEATGSSSSSINGSSTNWRILLNATTQFARIWSSITSDLGKNSFNSFPNDKVVKVQNFILCKMELWFFPLLLALILYVQILAVQLRLLILIRKQLCLVPFSPISLYPAGEWTWTRATCMVSKSSINFSIASRDTTIKL